MSKYQRHHVKLHRWENGVLNTIEAEFDSLDDALLFLNATPHSSAKVHDKDGSVLFASNDSSGFAGYA